MVGMTRKTAVMRLMTSSMIPPEYAARMPSVVASTVASSAAAAPTTSDERAPQTTCEKMSDPWSVVPKRWWNDGAWRPSSSENPFGSVCAIHGAMIATMMIEESTMMPPRDFGFPSSSFSQPGKRRRRRPVRSRSGPPTRAISTVAGGTLTDSRGWICDTATPSARAGRG